MKFILLSGAMLLTIAGSAQAQVLWESTGTVSGNYTGTDTDISTNGTFVAAVTEAGGLSSYPVVVSDADTTFDKGNDAHITNFGATGTDGSHSTATPYQSALDGVAYTFGSPGTFNLTGLNAADVYQVEIWNVDTSSSRETEYSSSGSAGTTSVNVYNGFVLGTISGETSQSISFQPASGGAGEVNAVSLRDLGAIPEPSTYAMLFGGIGILALVSRFRGKLMA